MSWDAALPVYVDADRRLYEPLVSFAEGTLGWQVTTGTELPAALRLAGVGSALPPPRDTVPTVLFVRNDDPPHLAASAARNAALVLRWPDDRDRLATEGPRLADHTARATASTVVFAGARGGVGTTTVVLAVGGLLAWGGVDVLAVGSGDVPVAGVSTVAPSALAAHRTWDAATVVRDTGGLRVVRALPGPRPDVAVPAGVVVLRDDGVADGADVLVVQRDRAGVEAVARSPAAAIVVVDQGPVVLRAVASAAARRPLVVVPWSVRVARATAVERVPSSLPGRWLRQLGPLARSIG